MECGGGDCFLIVYILEIRRKIGDIIKGVRGVCKIYKLESCGVCLFGLRCVILIFERGAK